MSDNHTSETPSTQSAAERRSELAEVSVSGLAAGTPTMRDIIEMAKLMAQSDAMIPPIFRGQPGMCAGIVSLASRVHMDPFAVASKAYKVKDTVAYEAQFVTALLNARAPITGRIKYEYEGEGQTRKCTAYCFEKETGDRIEYVSPEIGQIKTQNSPLWKADPDQQLAYYSGRALGRRHFPDVIMGVYTPDEVQTMHYGPDQAKDVTPRESLADRLKRGDAALPPIEDATGDPDGGNEGAEVIPLKTSNPQEMAEEIGQAIHNAIDQDMLNDTMSDFAQTINALPEEFQKAIRQAEIDREASFKLPEDVLDILAEIETCENVKQVDDILGAHMELIESLKGDVFNKVKEAAEAKREELQK